MLQTLLVVLLVIVAANSSVVWYGTPEAASYVGSCKELCCCPVCGVPTNDAFPYGLTEDSVALPFPKVKGASCHFSIWSDRPYNDSNGNAVTVPDTLFWLNYNVFLDYVTHTAPITCDCCRFSGVDTSCKETIPIATYPKYFFAQGGLAQEYQPISLFFMDGVQLNYTDVVQLRNDTYCGYSHPRPVQSFDNLTITNQSFTSNVNIPRLPPRGCYKVCYYASSLTTPQWYDLGYLTVNAKPQPSISFVWNNLDVLLAGNTATITYFGRQLLSVFDDIAELRTSGSCGSGSPTATTATGINGILSVISGTEWCKPAVVARITATRPLNYIAISYSDCGTANRVYQARTQWTLTLPVSVADVTYTVCYRTASTWYSAGTTFVPGQRTASSALQTLYTATNGATWIRSTGWGGTNPCAFYGVRCDINGKVVALYLQRNNLTGTIPSALFYAPYFSTLNHIALDMNSISGTVPREMGSLRNLNFLDLGFNNLSGTLPNTLDRTNLYITYAGNNQVVGSLPTVIESIGLSWTSYGNNLSDAPDPLQAPGCPTDVLECSEVGSTDYGTTQCGPDGMTQGACTAYGCCFNAQAPLTFGGTACFTKRRVTYLQYPPCQKLSCP
jgi:hypothetical protein